MTHIFCVKKNTQQGGILHLDQAFVRSESKMIGLQVWAICVMGPVKVEYP